MSASSQPSSKGYTLTLFTPSTATPTFLRHLQQSTLNTVWLGAYAGLFRKQSPSTWGWSHIMLAEGQGVSLPIRCRAEQTWSFEIDSADAFRPDPESCTLDGHEKPESTRGTTTLPDTNAPSKEIQACQCSLSHIKRFCVLIFYTDAVEKCYEQHLETLARHDGLGEKLDIRIQLIGRILKAEEKLGKHAKIPVTEVSKKKPKKWKPLESLKDLTPETPSSASSDSSPVAPQHPGFKHVVLMSFPSSKEHGQYLKSEERKGLEDTVGIDEVNDGMILAKHMLLPPKSQPISANDWTYGNPHEPYGHDWFG
jgi:hypothetical protein